MVFGGLNTALICYIFLNVDINISTNFYLYTIPFVRLYSSIFNLRLADLYKGILTNSIIGNTILEFIYSICLSLILILLIYIIKTDEYEINRLIFAQLFLIAISALIANSTLIVILKHSKSLVGLTILSVIKLLVGLFFVLKYDKNIDLLTMFACMELPAVLYQLFLVVRLYNFFEPKKYRMITLKKSFNGYYTNIAKEIKNSYEVLLLIFSPTLVSPQLRVAFEISDRIRSIYSSLFSYFRVKYYYQKLSSFELEKLIFIFSLIFLAALVLPTYLVGSYLIIIFIILAQLLQYYLTTLNRKCELLTSQSVSSRLRSDIAISLMVVTLSLFTANTGIVMLYLSYVFSHCIVFLIILKKYSKCLMVRTKTNSL